MNFSDYQLSYQVSPIVLVSGIAGTGMLPIVNLLNSVAYNNGITSNADDNLNNDAFFGQFRILPGHTLMDNEVATYPVANQSVAANAIITQPLHLALEMIAPASSNVTMSQKASIFTALKSSLDNHTALGGWYNVATPSYVYQGCLLTRLADASDGVDGAQVQVRWVWDFFQSLVTEQAAQAAQNQLMSKIGGRTQLVGSPPGSQPIATSVGQPSSNVTQNVIPSSTNLAAANVTPSSTSTGTTSIQAVSPIAPGT